MLEGTRVIDLSTDVAGAFGARLLATYGADVIKIEPPAGDPLRRAAPRAGDGPDEGVLFAYLNGGKRSVVLDLDDAADRTRVRALVSGADVLIESFAPGALAAVGLDPAELIQQQPGLVVCSITPYGQSGPRARWRATALTAFAAGGQMSLCGDREREPLKTAGHQAYYQAGLHAFSATLTALFAARRSGLGDWLDLSIQEVQASSLEGAGPAALVHGSEGGRSGNIGFAVWGIHECADGHIGVASMPRQSFAIYDLIEHPELKDDPEMKSSWTLPANQRLAELVPEYLKQHKARELFERAAKLRAPIALIAEPQDLLRSPHFEAIGFWHEVEHPVLGRHPVPGGPFELNGSRGEAGPAPTLGQHTEEVLATLEPAAAAVAPSAPASSAELPLAGLRVIDMTQVWAGPFGTRFLGDMGADVIKVEGPTFPDSVRTMTGARAVPEINQSVYFNEYARNKRGISLDITRPEGLRALRRLVKTADVFIENWSSGVAERLGVGWDDLRALKPDLVYVSMPGFGHRGPDAERIGFGPTLEQMGGLVALQGYAGGPPHRSGISYGDPISGTAAAGAVAAGLLLRERTGQGSYSVVAQRDVIVSLVGEYMLAEALGCPLPVRIGSRDPEHAPCGVYPGREGEPRPVMRRGEVLAELSDTWLTLAVDSEEAWRSLVAVIGDPALERDRYHSAAGRREHHDEIDARIAAWSRERDPEEAAALLQAEGVAASPVYTPLMIARDAHLEERGFFMPYTHPEYDRPARTTRPAWRLRRRPVTQMRSAPLFGEHSREVLRELAGYSDAEIDAFERDGLTAQDLLAP